MTASGVAIAIGILIVVIAIWSYRNRDIRCPECGERMILSKEKTKWYCTNCTHELNRK